MELRYILTRYRSAISKKFNNVATIMTALNHTDQRETMIYLGIEQEELDKQQSKIDW